MPENPEIAASSIAVITLNAIPAVNHTFKYDRLGQMAIANRRHYCRRHGYTFVGEGPIPDDRPACWAKIPAILRAFDTHRWVLWADSDTLVMDPSRLLEPFCDSGYDLVVQSHEEYFRVVGVPLAQGLDRMPINTGVFLIQATDWSRQFLERAYRQEQFVSRGEVWNGIGEQEAMIAVLREHPEDRRRIKYVEHLQNHPKFHRPGDLFVHFYGNHARHRLPPDAVEEVLQRWEQACTDGEALPGDLTRFHWCCIQNKDPEARLVRGDLPRYLYAPRDIGEPDEPA
jgi:galactosyl transferase GMA12/MNN10 family